MNVWVTTADGQMQLSKQTSVAFTTSAPGHETLVVDPTRRFQTMTGFGASITDSSASVLYSLSPTARDAAMHTLFDPRTGDGLDFLRQPIGASDFVAGSQHYTYDDMPPGQTDYLQQHFSIAHDEAQILPLLRQAAAINPDLTIMASPWSPPAWMKTSGSLIGGRLIDDPRIYSSYALYLVKFVEAYHHQGVDIKYITVQNEPQNRHPNAYPGTDMAAAQEEKVIEALGPRLREDLGTRILAFDHNWSEHPNDIASTPPDETSDTNNYPQEVLSSGAARWIPGVAFHCYFGDPSAMTAFHKQFPSVRTFETECSGIQSSNPANTFSDTLKWHSRNLEIGSTRNWSQSVVNWNLDLNPTGGPHLGGCGTCTGIVTIGPGDTVTPNAEYYAQGHLSRFVKPGAVRIASTSFGTTGWNGQIMDVAFVNPDRSTVLVVHNENDNPQSFSVSENGQSFDYTLPGASLATFEWSNPPQPALALRAIDPSGWHATANPPGPTNPCCTGDVAANAVDDDASTRYSTGQGQAPGEYLQVDLGRAQRVAELVLDTGASTGDYPRGYAVTVSLDGTTWSTAVAAGNGTGQITSIALDHRPIRYARVTLTAAVGNWWSVADVRAYGPSTDTG